MNHFSIWQLPKPLPKPKEPPPFPIEALPPPIRNYVTYIAETMQVYNDMPASLALAVLSMCLQKKAKVQFNSEWQEELNLYICVIADPAERKSAVFSPMMRPVNKYVQEYNNCHRYEILSFQNYLRKLEYQKESLIQKNADEAEINQIQNQILDLKPVHTLKLVTTDTTAEALACTLQENDERIAVMSDEGGIFDIIGGMYNKTVNLNIYLNGYDGQSVVVDRRCGNIALQRPLITFGICAQPKVLNDIMSNSTFCGKGLTQRFVFCVPKSMVGQRTLSVAEFPNSTVKDEYDKLIYSLLSFPTGEAILSLDNAAVSLFSDFFDEVENQLGTNGNFENYKDFFGKLTGRTLRMAGLLHLVTNTVETPINAYTIVFLQ